MAQEKHWQKGMPTHENIIFSCFGGLSNTGISNAQASFHLWSGDKESERTYYKGHFGGLKLVILDSVSADLCQIGGATVTPPTLEFMLE